MKKCPRCKKNTMSDDDVMNDLSRRDSKTKICNQCGTEEGLIDAGIQEADDRERAFVAKLKT